MIKKGSPIRAKAREEKVKRIYSMLKLYFFWMLYRRICQNLTIILQSENPSETYTSIKGFCYFYLLTTISFNTYAIDMNVSPIPPLAALISTSEDDAVTAKRNSNKLALFYVITYIE